MPISLEDVIFLYRKGCGNLWICLDKAGDDTESCLMVVWAI